MAVRESGPVLPSGIIRVRLHASPFVKVCFQFSMNSYDESAGAIGTPHNATGIGGAKCLQNQLNKSSRTLKVPRNGWSKTINSGRPKNRVWRSGSSCCAWMILLTGSLAGQVLTKKSID